jgi:hypothetical protein
MRPFIRSTLVGTVMLPAVLTFTGWAAGPAAASAPPPAITTAAGSHGAASTPASPGPAMPGMDMSGADGSGSMPGMDMGSGAGATQPGAPGGHIDPAPGQDTGSQPAHRPRALVLGGFAAVNGSVLLTAAVLRRRSARRRISAPPRASAAPRRAPVRVAISTRPRTGADVGSAQPEGASS